MYANRYDGSRTSRPVSAGAALLINGALVAGLWFARPDMPTIIGNEPIETTHIPLPKTPPPEPEKRPTVEKVATPTAPPIHRPDPIVTLPPVGPSVTTTPDLVPPTIDPPAGPAGSGAASIDPPPAPPVLTGAEIDRRFAGSFQPDYPGSELRQEKEGLVRVRVLIGVDGRIKAVEQLSSPTAGFFEATRRHALAKWRFKPATKDGIPVESWKVMTVRFQITS